MAEHNCHNMKNKNLVRFVHSLVLLPMITASFPFSGIKSIEDTQGLLVKKVNIEVGNSEISNNIDDLLASVSEDVKKARAEAIDAYFKEREMPLSGTGAKMVEEAIKNEIDWRLVPAIAVRESTGGKHECKRVPNNPFGWGSCKIGFKSYDEAIETVAKNLGGNNPNTAHHYDDKETMEILRAYNPPSVVPKYAEQVVAIMNAIGDKDLSKTLASAM